MLTTKPTYNIIVKSGNETFLKYRNVNNLLSFVRFLDTKHNGWKWFNVYDHKTKKQITNFTNKARPLTRFV